MANLKIVIAINYLAVGGTQTFAFGLAEGLSQRGHDVYIYDFNLPYHTKSLKELNSPLLKSKSLKFIQFSNPLPSIFYNLLVKLKPLEIAYIWLTNKTRIAAFNKFIRNVNAEVISSHLMAADTLSSRAIQKLSAVHCATMHGSYEGFPKAALKEKREKVFSRMNGIIYLTEKNIRFLDHLKRKNPLLKLKKIYNGYMPQLLREESPGISRAALNIDSKAFVFIQVARGTQDKGWKQAIEAFLLLCNKTTTSVYLILVGDGPYLSGLKKYYSLQKNILFYGYSGNPVPLIELADVGLLATYYKGESLPNTIIEYLFAGKPVIATDIGEINAMIGVNTNNPSGFTLSFNTETGLDPEALSAKMLEYITDKEIYNRHAKNTYMQSEKFKMETCASLYEAFFLELKAKQTL
jgi:glycosyltransferase involved in cell wall biosynthesis